VRENPEEYANPDYTDPGKEAGGGRLTERRKEGWRTEKEGGKEGRKEGSIRGA
jgi:hypothetical protein